jgi:hypothetical protein
VLEEMGGFFELEASAIKVNTYGLTGAGVHFVNSTIKMLVRMNKAPEKLTKLEKFFNTQEKD